MLSRTECDKNETKLTKTSSYFNNRPETKNMKTNRFLTSKKLKQNVFTNTNQRNNKQKFDRKQPII